jgi:hypothetical protein
VIGNHIAGCTLNQLADDIQKADHPVAYVVSVLRPYNSKSYMSHLTAAKRVLQYLKGAADAKLVFPGRALADTPVLISYTDSDYAIDRADRRSQGGAKEDTSPTQMVLLSRDSQGSRD